MSNYQTVIDNLKKLTLDPKFERSQGGFLKYYYGKDGWWGYTISGNFLLESAGFDFKLKKDDHRVDEIEELIINNTSSPKYLDACKELYGEDAVVVYLTAEDQKTMSLNSYKKMIKAQKKLLKAIPRFG